MFKSLVAFLFIVSVGVGAQAYLTPTIIPAGPPTGAAGGDLSSDYPDPLLASIQGVPVYGVAPNIGFEQSAPSATLHLGDGRTDNIFNAGLYFSSGDGNGNARDWQILDSGPVQIDQGYDNIGDLWFEDMGFDNANNGPGYPYMVISPYGGGQVGIGTGLFHPQALLEVSNNGAGGNTWLQMTSYNNSAGPQFFSQVAEGSQASPVTLNSGDRILFVGGGGYDGTSFSSLNDEFIDMLTAETWASGAHGTTFQINTTHIGTASPQPIFYIDGNQNVGFFTNNPQSQFDYEGGNNPATNGRDINWNAEGGFGTGDNGGGSFNAKGGEGFGSSTGGGINLTGGNSQHGASIGVGGTVNIAGGSGQNGGGGQVNIFGGSDNGSQPGGLVLLQGGEGFGQLYSPIVMQNGGGNVGIGPGATAPGSTLTVVGHIETDNPASGSPVSADCGTIDPASSDNKGQITGIIAATTCMITFNSAMPAGGACVVSSDSASAQPYIGSLSTTQLLINMTALTGTLYYICF